MSTLVFPPNVASTPVEPPGLVLSDVMRGHVSPERARDEYGVAIDAAGPGVDAEETARLRRAPRE